MTIKVIDEIERKDGTDRPVVKAARVSVDPSGFTGNLSDTDTDVQTALETIDQMAGVGGAGYDTIQGSSGVPVAQESVLEVRGIRLTEGTGKTVIEGRVHGVLDFLPNEASRTVVQGYTVDITAKTAPSHEIALNSAIIAVEPGSMLQIEPGGYLTKEGFVISGAADLFVNGIGSTIYTHPDHISPIHPSYAYAGLNDYNSLNCTIQDSSGVTLSNVNFIGNYLNTTEKSSYAFTLFVDNVDKTLILSTNVSECKGGVMFNDASNSGFRDCSVQTKNFNNEVFYVSKLSASITGNDDIAIKAFDHHGWSTGATSRRSYKVKISSVGIGGFPDKFVWCRRESISTEAWGAYGTWTTVERDIPLWDETFYTTHSGGVDATVAPGEVLAKDPLLNDDNTPLTEDTNFVDPRDSIYKNRSLISIAWKNQTGHTVGDEWEFEWLGTDPTMLYIAKNYTIPNPEWVALASYVVGDIINQSHNNPFKCLVDHTASSSFADDFILGYWVIDPSFWANTTCINNYVDNCDFGNTPGTDLNFFIKGQKNLDIRNSRIPYPAVTCLTDFRVMNTQLEGMELGWTNGTSFKNCSLTVGLFFYGGNKNTTINNCEFKNFGFAPTQAGVENHAAAIRISTSADNSFVGGSENLIATNNTFNISYTDRVYYGVYWLDNTHPISGELTICNNTVIGDYCVEVNDLLYNIIDKPISEQRYGGTLTGAFTVRPLPGNKVILEHNLVPEDLCIVRNSIVNLSGFANSSNNGFNFSVLKLNPTSILLHGSINRSTIEDVYAGPSGELYITVTDHGLTTGATCAIEGMSGFAGLIGTTTRIDANTLSIDNSYFVAGYTGGTIFDVNSYDTCTDIYLPLQVIAGTNDVIYFDLNSNTTELVPIITTAMTDGWICDLVMATDGAAWPGWESTTLAGIIWDFGIPSHNLYAGETLHLKMRYNPSDTNIHVYLNPIDNIKHYTTNSISGSTSQSNLVIGKCILPSIIGATNNTIISNRPLLYLASSTRCNISGDYAGRYLTTGSYDSFTGYKCGEMVTTGSWNTGDGARALGRASDDDVDGLSTGSYVTGAGPGAGQNVLGGTSYALFLGPASGTRHEDNSYEFYVDVMGNKGRSCLLYGKYDSGAPTNSILKTPGTFDAAAYTKNGSPLSTSITYLAVTLSGTYNYIDDLGVDSGAAFKITAPSGTYYFVLPASPSGGDRFTFLGYSITGTAYIYGYNSGEKIRKPNGDITERYYSLKQDEDITFVFNYLTAYWEIEGQGKHAYGDHTGTAPVSFPGFGTSHSTAAYGDHSHLLASITDITASLAIINNLSFDAQISGSTAATFTSTSSGDIGTFVILPFDTEDQLPSVHYSLASSALTVKEAGNYISEFGFSSMAGATAMRWDLKFRVNGSNIFHRYFQGDGGAYEVGQYFTTPKLVLSANDVIDLYAKRISGSAVGETWTLSNIWLRLRKVV